MIVRPTDEKHSETSQPVFSFTGANKVFPPSPPCLFSKSENINHFCYQTTYFKLRIREGIDREMKTNKQTNSNCGEDCHERSQPLFFQEYDIWTASLGLRQHDSVVTLPESGNMVMGQLVIVVSIYPPMVTTNFSSAFSAC